MVIRKILNFGHTLGHAIETYCLDHDHVFTLLHGEAIAIGMILEGYLSSKLCGLSQEELKQIKTTFYAMYPSVVFNKQSIKEIIGLMQSDKKNSHGRVNFVLLNSIGQCQMDVAVDEALILEAFEYYSA